jgi:class 3 adenylate cyclase
VITARTILEEVSLLDVAMRAGLHTGEKTVLDDDIGGIGVHIASRVMSRAPDGGIAVSITVKDLTVGSSVYYVPLGVFTLKGVPDDWTLYAVT